MNGYENLDNLRSAFQQMKGDARADGRGKVYAFMSPFSHAGTSYVARNIALIAAEGIDAYKKICIIDMDLQNNAQSNWFFSPQIQSIYGAPQGPYDATFGQIPFWRVTPSMVNEVGKNVTDQHFMSMHILAAAKVSFTHFHWEKFRQGQNVHIQSARAFWHALRENFAAIFVDIPAFDRSNLIDAVCPEMDVNVLVAPHSMSRNPELDHAHARITSLGAHCAGVIMNDPPHVVNEYGQPL
jgi:hypothetical protein